MALPKGSAPSMRGRVSRKASHPRRHPPNHPGTAAERGRGFASSRFSKIPEEIERQGKRWDDTSLSFETTGTAPLNSQNIHAVIHSCPRDTHRKETPLIPPPGEQALPTLPTPFCIIRWNMARSGDRSGARSSLASELSCHTKAFNWGGGRSVVWEKRTAVGAGDHHTSLLAGVSWAETNAAAYFFPGRGQGCESL